MILNVLKQTANNFNTSYSKADSLKKKGDPSKFNEIEEEIFKVMQVVQNVG